MRDLKPITVKANVELVEKARKELNMRTEFFSIGSEAVKAKFRVNEWDEFILDSIYYDGLDISKVIVSLDKWEELEEDFSDQLRESVKEWKKNQ
jgi:hypothetical protein